MNNVTRIVISCLCAALALSSCQRKNDTTPVKPEQEPANVPVGFTAASQATWVKALADDSLAKYHKDFGVWGIAHQDGNDVPCILWDADEMTQVVAEETSESTSEKPQYTGVFKPVVDAYWLSGYSYNFIAVAPYEAAGPNNSTVAIDKDSNTLSFTYDMAAQYGDANYAFDLLGAAATKKVETASEEKSQELVFWHLLSKIRLKVTFKDASGTAMDGTINAIRLSNVVTEADYTVSFDAEVEDDDKDTDYPLNVVYTSSTDDTDKITYSDPIVFNQENKDDSNATDPTWTLHIVPQIVSGFVMYIDFTIGETCTNNFKVDLSAAGTKQYNHNEAYNWNINITPKGIVFEVSVTDWGNGNADAGTDETFDFELQ